MLWWGRSLALIQIMFQSLLEDLKPCPGSLEDRGNEACWDFNHFYICWKIRRKEKRKKLRKKKNQHSPHSTPALRSPSIPFSLWWKKNNLFWGLIMKKKCIKSPFFFFPPSTFVFSKFSGLEISQPSTSMLKTPPTISEALSSPSPRCKINKSFWY